jgi:hypothetical protein
MSGCTQGLDRFRCRRVRVHVDPTFRTAGHGVGRKERLDSFDDVKSINTERITRPNDGGAVVRIVRRVHENRYRVKPLT